MRKVLVISGMTATGKSSAAIQMAKRFNGEIISADSVAVYRECTIGSAKILPHEQEGIPHHLIDTLSYREKYSVKAFQQDAKALIESISERGKLPIIVGGTGLYIRALLWDYPLKDEEPRSTEHLDALSNEQLYQKLCDEDREAANVIHINNRKRLLRALIRYESQQADGHIEPQPEPQKCYDDYTLIFSHERSVLYQSINQRVRTMIDRGLEAEVRGLIRKDEDWHLQSMQAIGYREFQGYFAGEYNLEALIELIQKNTRNFAKRQITWFKHQSDGQWVDMNEMTVEFLEKEIEAWLEKN